METLLSKQLPQACLETQMGKHQADLKSSAPTSDKDGTFTSPALQLSSSDTTSALAPQLDLHEEAFQDPVLQYINDMLMEEDMEDRKCMMLECMSYFATVKGFYDILGTGEVPPLPCLNRYEQLNVSGEVPHDSFNRMACEEGLYSREHHLRPNDGVVKDASRGGVYGDEQPGFSAISDDEHPRVSFHDGPILVRDSMDKQGPLNISVKEDNLARISPHDGERPYQGSNQNNVRIDDVLNNMSAVSHSEQEARAGVVPLHAVTESSILTVQGTPESWSQASIQGILEQDGASVWYPSMQAGSAFTDSAAPSFQWRDSSGDRQQHEDLVADGSYLTWCGDSSGVKFFNRSVSDSITSKVPSSTSSSRFKRSASEVDSLPDGSHNIAGRSGVMGVSIEEDKVSFVKNKNLQAESYARFLNNGLGQMTFKSSTASSVPVNAGKGTLKVATTADLKGLLISCAQAVASSNLQRAHEILQEIRQDASPYGSGLQRLAHYFTEGLVARMSGTGGRLYTVFTSNVPSAAKLLKAHHLYVEVCPFVRISHYFANRAIIEAVKGASRLHIIDYGILYGLQWPSLISALAERKGGPPILRITGIDFPQLGLLHAERVEMTGKRLAEYARTYGVPFEYHTVASRWEVIELSSLQLREDEVVIVNSMHRLHHLLDETVLASNPRKTVLSKIAEINPKLFVLGIKNGNYNAPFFLSRFNNALASFSGAFDLLETTIPSDNQERMMIERELLGRDIMNVVACEGPERVERPETYRQWHNRIVKAGLGTVPLDEVVVKEAQMIVRRKYNKNFGVDEDGPWMLLSWKGKVVHGLSLWKCTASN